MKGINVELEDKDGKLVGSYYLRKMNISASSRRYGLYEQIAEKSITDSQKNQMMVAANLIVVLCGEDEKLLYPAPTDDSVDTSLDKFYDEMDDDIFSILSNTNMEINPPSTSLKTKKKKY